MAKQIQLRRGSTAEHENFIGATGEVTVDTDLNTLRVHDGTTPGGHIVRGAQLPDSADYVVETQYPSESNGYIWYRKYKSGWVEQGGFTAATGISSVMLPVPLSQLCCFSRGQTMLSGTSTASHNTLAAVFGNADTTKVQINGGGYWLVCGIV